MRPVVRPLRLLISVRALFAADAGSASPQTLRAAFVPAVDLLFAALAGFAAAACKATPWPSRATVSA